MIRTMALADQFDAVLGGVAGGGRTHRQAAHWSVPAPRPASPATGPVLVRRSVSTGPVRRPHDEVAPTFRGGHRLDGPCTLDRMLHRADARRLAAIA